MSDCFPTIRGQGDERTIQDVRALTLASTVWFAGEAAGQTPPTLDQIRSSKTLRIAYDADAPPFSYIAPGSPTTAAPQGLAKGQVAAYFADRATLTFLLRKEKEAASLLMADTYLSIEPIALALRRGDSDFRLAVDTALSHIYRRGEIVQVFKGAFGPLTTPSPC